MIPASTRQQNAPAWQRELAQAIRDPGELLTQLGLSAGSFRGGVPGATAVGGFPLRVPRAYAARMRPGDPGDPLLAQVLPTGAEHDPAAGFGPDPVGDRAAMIRPGVLHKYRGRVLLVTTGACAVHCRYCFRREFPYAEANARPGQWREALAYIADDPSIHEVILSGGDPLSLHDGALADLVERLQAIPHLTTLRLHTRLPVVLPARVDEALCAWLAATRLQTVVVLHANHANELDESCRTAAHALAGTGAWLLNQSVLLRGVNDSADALSGLSHRLFTCGVLPYYLHLLDPVRGAAHFEVPEPEARGLLAQVAARLPGYLVPRLVREEAGRPGKTPRPYNWSDGLAIGSDRPDSELGLSPTGPIDS